jgi:AraC-like DNA-binding protein
MLGRLTLIPPQSLVYVRNTRLLIQAARGEHETIVLSWSGRNTLVLEEWMTGRDAPKNDKGESRTLGVKPINPHFLGAIERLKQTTLRESAVTELEVFSVIYECVGKLMTGSDEMQLASLPVTMPESMSELIASVRENPAGSWPLREASDRAGYSPFHFSRIFKSIVGYGFHEFVDRCRTESAVKMLLVSELSVDSIAQKCGFGTTQGLRESVKEYLGLVPSELRSLPEIPGSSLLR